MQTLKLKLSTNSQTPEVAVLQGAIACCEISLRKASTNIGFEYRVWAVIHNFAQQTLYKSIRQLPLWASTYDNPSYHHMFLLVTGFSGILEPDTPTGNELGTRV